MKDAQISEGRKVMAKALIAPLMSALAVEGEGDVTAQGMAQVLAYALAGILDTDETLKTDRDFKAAGDYIGKLVTAFAKQHRKHSDDTGTSFIIEASRLSG